MPARPSTRPATPTPVRPTAEAHAAQSPTVNATITAGFWAERRDVNARVSIAQGPDRLTEAGNLRNLRRAADGETSGYEGGVPFMDTDVHKWLEAAGWQLGDPTTDPGQAAELAERVREIAGLLAAAQQPSGYLNSYYQVAKPEAEHFTELRWGHELYTAGHLIQAAVAHHRATGERELLDVAVRFADHLVETFGPEGSGKPVDSVDGHPEIETALVELARETGDARYTELAGYFVGRYGGVFPSRSTKGPGRAGYCQDHLPVREAPAVTGHSVRQLYLLAGVADLAAETGEPELRATAERLWRDMAARQSYLTGGIGAHHSDEGFGHPYELPNERAYAETCAAIAAVQFGWRMALLTGEARYSDLAERTLYNAVLCGVSLRGDTYLYDNPLHVRDGHADQEGARPHRTPWFSCACCPPNIMRLLASLPGYLAATSTDGGTLHVHQYAAGTLAAPVAGARAALRVTTDYPWDGRIALTVEETGGSAWTLALRVPHWSATGWRLAVNGASAPTGSFEHRDGWLRLTRTWAAGDTVELTLDLAPRFTLADPRVDAARGCVAVERGPLVYCVEAIDQPKLPAGLGLDDLVVDTAAGIGRAERDDLPGGVTGLTLTARPRPRPEPDDAAPWWPYRSLDDAPGAPGGEPLTLTAIPYHAWANREVSAMRVWLPADA
ncbi:glycoside hydrolase family 127 protein [Streptomyces triticirhizae]|uniref:Glycoside hydrolase family 127 protein n=1 Tax=Streptomyces triticirhizae TaxID=2483353 RepID=A0A3M2M802_9ACTN|nr:beta-L-arabinofuranosidase domain-containing protein [Streptomyces triticirhizae]RMI44973.1 glycoside hydrolase family 127 protein [Streptomyces triticirhizae]